MQKSGKRGREKRPIAGFRLHTRISIDKRARELAAQNQEFSETRERRSRTSARRPRCEHDARKYRRVSLRCQALGGFAHPAHAATARKRIDTPNGEVRTSGPQGRYIAAHVRKSRLPKKGRPHSPRGHRVLGWS